MRFRWPWVRRQEQEAAIGQIRMLASEVALLVWQCERGDAVVDRLQREARTDALRISKLEREAEALKRVEKMLSDIVGREVERRYVRPDGPRECFMLQFRIQPDLMRGLSSDQESMRLLAFHVARSVEHEIATARFLQRVDDGVRPAPFQPLAREWGR